MLESHIFGDSLRETRKTYGLTQTRVAKWMDVAPSSVMRWEQYETHPSRTHKIAWIKIYDTLETYPPHLWDERIEELKKQSKGK